MLNLQKSVTEQYFKHIFSHLSKSSKQTKTESFLNRIYDFPTIKHPENHIFGAQKYRFYICSTLQNEQKKNLCQYSSKYRQRFLFGFFPEIEITKFYTKITTPKTNAEYNKQVRAEGRNLKHHHSLCLSILHPLPSSRQLYSYT